MLVEAVYCIMYIDINNYICTLIHILSVCVCGSVCVSVVQYCPLTHHLRQTYNFNSVEDLFSDQFPPEIVCEVIHEVLDAYM